MILDLINSYVKLSKYNFEKYDDDSTVDKLCRKFSAIMMIVLTSLLGIIQLVGKPMQCWCMNEYSGSRCNYAQTYCYLTSFYIPIGNTTVLPKRDELESHKILYYQWVPFIFLLQAFLFYFPSMVWRVLNTRSSFDLNAYIQSLKKDESDLKDNPATNFVSHHIQTCLELQNYKEHRGRVKKLIVNSFCCKFFNNGFYLAFSYIFVKFVYLAMVYIQIYLLNNWFLDNHYSKSSDWLLGPHVWNLEERFPHMTLCKFQVYILSDQQTHWIQCALPLNIYLRKIYLIIFIWLCFLFLLICSNIAYTFYFILNGSRFISNELKDLNRKEVDNLRRFLKLDGLIVFKLLKSNTSKYYVSNILNKLNDNYSKMN